MSIPVHCWNCGYSGIAQSIQIRNSTGSFFGGGEVCPRCGGLAEFQSGTYAFVQDVLVAFAAPGTSLKQIEEAKRIVLGASRGEIASDEALTLLRGINAQLAKVVEQGRGSRINWDRVLAILALLQALWVSWGSDADVQAALKESQTRTEITQKMLEALQKQRSVVDKAPPKVLTQSPRQRQMSPSKNRAERRKAAAIERRQKKRDQ